MKSWDTSIGSTCCSSIASCVLLYLNIVLVDRQGGIWADTHSGLYRLWFGRKPLQPMKTTDADEEEVHALYADHQGRTWVADERILTIHRRAAFHETPYAWMLSFTVLRCKDMTNQTARGAI